MRRLLVWPLILCLLLLQGCSNTPAVGPVAKAGEASPADLPAQTGPFQLVSTTVEAPFQAVGGFDPEYFVRAGLSAEEILQAVGPDTEYYLDDDGNLRMDALYNGFPCSALIQFGDDKVAMLSLRFDTLTESGEDMDVYAQFDAMDAMFSANWRGTREELADESKHTDMERGVIYRDPVLRVELELDGSIRLSTGLTFVQVNGLVELEGYEIDQYSDEELSHVLGMQHFVSNAQMGSHIMLYELKNDMVTILSVTQSKRVADAVDLARQLQPPESLEAAHGHFLLAVEQYALLQTQIGVLEAPTPAQLSELQRIYEQANAHIEDCKAVLDA